MNSIKPKLIALFTTIAVLALPTAEAAARHFGHA